MEKVDVAVIGAGVVGCAIARHFKIKYPDRRIVVFESGVGVGLETSRLNSGVLHSGIHEKPGSLKANLALSGSRLAVQFSEESGIPIMNCGMLVVAGHRSLIGGMLREWKSFVRMVSHAKERGINYKFLFGKKQLRKLEPNVRALGGVFLPEVWVLDPQLFTQKLAAEAEAKGVEFYFESGVKEISRSLGRWDVSSPNFSCRAAAVINAAGLYADDVAAMAGFTGYKIYPWRGEYYEVIGDKSKLINRLVYIVTPPPKAGKGIHFSPRVDGRLFLGPSARAVPAKNFYTEEKTPLEVFLEAGQRFCPELKAGDLRWGYSGIRPRLAPDSAERDFVISLDCNRPAFLNLVGIESPGLTASMSIAEHVEDMMRNKF